MQAILFLSEVLRARAASLPTAAARAAALESARRLVTMLADRLASGRS